MSASRFVRPLQVILAAAVGLSSALAPAQQPGPGAPMPLALDLTKVPIGTQAEYATTMGGLPPMNIKLALVARTPAGVATLETTAEGGMMAMAGGKVVVDSVLDTDHGKGDPSVKKLVMQIGSNDPMEMPSQVAHGDQFKRPDPKTLVGEETVKVKAGSFKTKHYRDKTSAGDKVDYWVSEAAPPLGLVKMQADTKNAAAAAGPAAGMVGSVTIELVGLSKGAKQLITKPAKPFDEAKLRQQVMSGMGAGPPPQPPPAPAPGEKK